MFVGELAENPWSVSGSLRYLLAKATRCPAAPASWLAHGLGSRIVHALYEHDLFLPIDFLKFHFDDFVAARLNHASRIPSFNRKLAVAAVDEHKQLNPRGASVIEQRIEG